MIVRVDRRVAAISGAETLGIGRIGQHLVDIHVEGDAAAAMERVHRKGFGTGLGQKAVDRTDDRLAHGGIDRAGFDIRARRRLLDVKHRIQEQRIIRKARAPAKRIEFNRALRLDAIERRFGHGMAANTVEFLTGRGTIWDHRTLLSSSAGRIDRPFAPA